MQQLNSATDWTRLPSVASGQKIGLFGGSFNPPHAGHSHAAITALKRLHLDSVWWLVSPGNPLKSPSKLLSMEQRVAQCSVIGNHPSMRITGYEAVIQTSYSANTIQSIMSRNYGVSFVWIMGADSLQSFQYWERWQFIAEALPIAIVERPSTPFGISNTLFAQRYARFRLEEFKAVALPRCSPPRWVFLHAPHHDLSSSELRNTPLPSNCGNPEN